MRMRYHAMTWVITGGILAIVMTIDAWLYHRAWVKYRP